MSNKTTLWLKDPLPSKNNISLLRFICDNTANNTGGVFVHCSLVDSNHVLLNDHKARILSYVHLRRDEKIVIDGNKNYLSAPLIDSQHVNEINFWLTDSGFKETSKVIYPVIMIIEIT